MRIMALARGEAEQERVAAEGARTELAKALLRLEAMPRPESELAALHTALDQERAGRASLVDQLILAGPAAPLPLERIEALAAPGRSVAATRRSSAGWR